MTPQDIDGGIKNHGGSTKENGIAPQHIVLRAD